MPRPAKGTRLYLKGKGEHAYWIIKDGDRRIATGCRAGDRAAAEIRLAAHIANRYAPARSKRDLAAIPIADVIAIYLTDIVGHKPDPAQRKRDAARAERLLHFFGKRTLADIRGSLCRQYRDARGSNGGARRDLQDLSAAIGHHHAEGFHVEDIRVWLPPAGEPRDRWLTRSEIARLVWSAWSAREHMRRSHADKSARRLPTAKRTGKHIARAILFAYYTASRPGDALRASFHLGAGRSWVDLEAGIFYRKPQGKIATAKRQMPCRISDRLMAHLRRWKAKSCASYVVEYDGRPICSIKTGLDSAIARAGLGEGVSAYTLRHSRATHMLQAGISTWGVAEALSTSEAMIVKHYGHHDINAMRAAVNAR